MVHPIGTRIVRHNHNSVWVYPFGAASLAKSIYVMQRSGGGPVKIGVAGNVRQRKATMQTSIPEPLIVVIALESSDAYLAEKIAHKALAEYRAMNGEWFNVRREVAVQAIQYAVSDVANSPAGRSRRRKLLMAALPDA